MYTNIHIHTTFTHNARRHDIPYPWQKGRNNILNIILIKSSDDTVCNDYCYITINVSVSFFM